MSTTSSPAQLQSEPFGAKLRHAALATLFAFVLLVPRILHLRRSPRSWMLCRILLGLVGAALVIWPLGQPNSYVLAVIGLSMFVAAILLPSAKPAASVNEKARELGALIVVNGGQLSVPNARPAAVQLFVGVEKISALDARFQPLLIIPVDQITSAHAEESGDRWLLNITWADRAVQFTYRGIFAEHLARVAETTLCGVMRPALPVLPQRRAASA
jgi:hypothetical protein